MRWVKAMIITVLVLAIIPSIVLTINKITSGKTERVEHEIIINEDNITETVYELYNLVKLDENNEVTNWLYVEYKGGILDVVEFYYDDSKNALHIRYSINSSLYLITLDLDNPVGDSVITGTLKIGLYEIVIKPSVSRTELILISLIPLILVSGLLIYQYKELKIRKE